MEEKVIKAATVIITATTSYPGRGKQGTSGTGSHRAQGKYGCAGNAAV